MSLVSSSLAAALSAVANALGETLEYRTTIGSGSFTTLTGFVLDRDEVLAPSYEEQQGAEATVRTGRLSGPTSPALAVGYEIRDGNSDTWAVETREVDQQQLCRLRRITLDNAGPDRGGDS